MPLHSAGGALQVALIGNPNTGKSTLFSALVGVHQRVGNYPGVTVEKRTGRCEVAGRPVEVVDLPGLYSLSPRSRDELVAVEVLLGCLPGTPPIDAVLCIVDASNLKRNLYLVSQVLELRLPTIVVLNMLDVAESHGIGIDLKRLEERLGAAVIPAQANRGIGLAELREALGQLDPKERAASPACFPEPFDIEVARLAGQFSQGAGRSIPLWLAQRVLLDSTGLLLEAALPDLKPHLQQELSSARARLAAAGFAVPKIEATARYDWVRRVLDGAASHPPQRAVTTSDRIDRILTHRLWGTLVFALLVMALFQAVFVWAEPLMNGIGFGLKSVESWLGQGMAEGALRSLLIDGVLKGVGAVLTFLPQILVLFLFLGILEDCGYLARAAYLMDELMVRVGLSGKSFLPLLSSFACAVPGIMATRVIENSRDRLATILVAPLMTCSARLPIFALLIAAFVPRRTYWGGLLSLQGLTLVALYLLGIVVAVVVARLLKRTVLRGDVPPFLMELPSYKWPSARTVALRVVERVYSFVRFAGTMILAVSILVWAALYYPHDRQSVEDPFRDRQEQLQSRLDSLVLGDSQRPAVNAELAAVEREIAGAYQRQSYLGRLGRRIEPVFRPLGWDWRIGSAVMASFPAREIVVATLGVIFSGEGSLADAPDDDVPELAVRLREARWEGTDVPLFNLPVALSIMVFFALCAQCAATLAVIRQETNSWRWPVFTVAYMTGLAYCGALATYQIGMWIGG